MEGSRPAQVSAGVRGSCRHDLDFEVTGVADLHEGIAAARAPQGCGSRELMVEILADEEHHEDHLTTQLELIEKVGLENYLAAQMSVAGAVDPRVEPSAVRVKSGRHFRLISDENAPPKDVMAGLDPVLSGLI